MNAPMTPERLADLTWLRKAERWGEWERFDAKTGDRESIWMMKSTTGPTVRFYAIGAGQVGNDHAHVVAATYWAYATGYLRVVDDPDEIFLELACRSWVTAGGAVRP